MLINPQTRQKVKEAIQSGSVNTLFTPPTNRNLNQTKSNIIVPPSVIPASFGNVTPLIGSDGKTEFTAMEALAEAQKNGKVLSSLRDSDPYVLQNGGYHWTGEAVIYPAPNEKFGQKITYTDGNKVSYECAIPAQFQNETRQKALKLMNGYFNNDINAPHFEFRQDLKTKIWTLQINQPDALIQSGLLKLVSIPRKDDYYLTDGELVPNGAKSDSKNSDARYFYRVDNGSYLGLFLRDGGDGRRGVGAYGGPSGSHGVLAYV